MNIAIIGSGVAGAAAARLLRREGARPVVLESADDVAGRTRTVEHGDGFRTDAGAIFLMGSYARTLEYLRQSGHAAATHRWVARGAVLDEHGVLHPVRLDQPWSFLRMPQLTWRDRARIVRTIGGLADAPGPRSV
ncbi:MAG: NAD(P)-binding protein [Actinomycetota bacterium]|nr:NAD(P)-binding protein [Actinomycetota bacterium]